MASIPKILLPSFKAIEAFSRIEDLTVEELSFVPGNNVLVKRERKMTFEFSTKLTKEINVAYESEIGKLTLKKGAQTYCVPEHHSYFASSLQFNPYGEQEFIININEIYDTAINLDGEYYWRCIQPIDRENWIHHIRTFAYESENHHFNGGLLCVNFPQGEVHSYPVKWGDQLYLVTDCLAPVKIKDIRAMAYSVCLGLGLLLGTVHLNEMIVVASNTPDHNAPIGIHYSSIRESIKSNYLVFTTNMYSLEVAFRINGNENARKKLLKADGEVDANRVDWLYMDFFERLVLSLYNSSPLSRATSIVIEASTQPLEYQAALFCVAFETITTVLKDQKDQEAITPVDNKIYKKHIRPELLSVIKQKFDEGYLDEDGERILRLRVLSSLNGLANAGKLSTPFEDFGYKLSDLENLAIDQRNPLLHGSFLKVATSLEEEWKGFIFTSTMLHRLCCILLLKNAGFDSFLVNNALLYGIKEVVDADEDVLIKI